jgi:predicted metalloprotease
VFTETFAAIRSQDASPASVQLRILADGDDRTGCGRAPGTAVLGMYCLKDRTVYTNRITLQALDQRFGSGAVRYLAAHELARGRQHAVTGFSSGLVWSSVVDELQADCIAGAYLRMAYGITSESPQTAGILAFAEKIGDHSILDRDWHGTPAGDSEPSPVG